MNATLIESVSQLLARAACEIAMPHFGRLADDQVIEKSPGELVTVADRAIEKMLIPELVALRPGSRVVGEEGVAENPALMKGLDQGEVWIVDPIDGTANFVAGRQEFAIMVALVADGETQMSWIHFPVTGSLAIAEKGAGAWLDGARLQLPARAPQRPDTLQGMIKTGFMPQPLRSQVERRAARVQERIAGTQSACGDYVASALGSPDFSLYWRTLPWDHAPGTLLISEAGGHVARIDGSAYRPGDDAKGLLVARSREVWVQARDLLLATA